jgi:hypothetical protein
MNNFTRTGLFIFLLMGFGLTAYAQEPTNHPTAFTAATQAGGTSVKLDWTGSIGANLPSNYLILVRIVPGGTFAAPVDAAAVANDNDLADNLGAFNAPHAVGANTYTWTSLPIDTDFEFIIYPYKTGAAPDPNFKTDGSPLTVTASTKRPTVTTPTVTAIGETGATLGGNVTSNGGNTLTEKGTVWKATAGVSATDNKVVEGTTATGVFTTAQSGMPSGSQIFYRAFATNVAGTTLSAESSFFTYSTVPDNHPAVTASAIGPQQINLSFASVNANPGNIEGYIILRRTAADPPTSDVTDGVAPNALAPVSSTVVAIITDQNQNSFNDTGLTPNTEYRYAVVPFNWNGVNPETYNYKVGAGFIIGTFTTRSASSNITFTGGTNAFINYRNRIAATIDDTNLLGSQRLANFKIQDGGGASDADNVGTRVTSITVTVSNPENLRRIALFFDDVSGNGDFEYSGTEQNPSGTVTFTPSTPLDIADNDDLDIMVRCTFLTTVDDNEPIQITISAVGTPTTGYSGFAAANAGGATTGVTNRIYVEATKFIVFAGATSANVNQVFSVEARAVDSNYNNLDVDFVGQASLLKLSGNGTLTTGSDPVAPFFVGGKFVWDDLRLNDSGAHQLEVSDDIYGDSISDVQHNITINTSGANITQPATLNMCFGGVAQTLGNIVITETTNSGFSAGGTFTLTLPNGFVFDQTVTGIGPTVGGGSDISAPTNYSYPSATVVQFSYAITGFSNINTITIGGLKIRALHPGGSSPSTNTGSITRAGGTAVVAGDVTGTVHGTVSASLGTPPAGGVNFTVDKVNANDVSVAPGETRFAQSAQPVRLVGTPAGGTFTGSGVTFVSGQYRFNPQALSPGLYPIVYSVTNGVDQCEFVFQKQFEVYVTNIVNLSSQYCTNSPASLPLDVNQSYIDGRYGTTFHLTKFVYWKPGTGALDMVPLIANPNADGVGPLPEFTSYFDAADPDYQSIYAISNGIWIGFYVSNGSSTFLEWQFIPVRVAPTPTISITDLNFCADEPAVQLIGSPANSNVIGDDFFTATQGGTITQGGSPVQWFFNPVSATGVTDGNPASIDVTYTYRDPATGCTGTSAPKTLIVAKRPAAVVAAALTTPVSQAVCQGKSAPQFLATADPDITYTWYLADKVTQVGVGNTFSPTGVDTNVPGSTTFWVKQTVDLCESNSGPAAAVTPLELEVTVTATPGPPATNRSLEYCVGETIPANAFLIPSANAVNWYKTGDFSSPIITDTNPTAAELGITNATAGFYFFDVTQTEPGGCEGTPNPTKVTVEIKALPALSIETTADLMKICTSGPQIVFQGKDGASSTTSGTWTGAGLTGLVPGAGNAVLTTTNLLPNNYTLGYQYTNARGCTNSTSVPLKVLPKVIPSIAPLDSCEGIFVRLNNTSTINSGPHPPGAYKKITWNFSDGSGLAMSDAMTDVNTPVDYPNVNSGRTQGTYFNPEHRFATTGAFAIQYTIVTTDNCSYQGTKQLTINPKPKINFSWMGVCRDTLTGNSSTTFQAAELSQPPILIPAGNYTWDFNVDDVLTYAAAGSGANPTVNYNVNGRDSARLIVVSNAQCRDTVQKPIFVVPSFTRLREENSYSQDFNTDDGGWIAGGSNSSWAHGQPNGPVVNMDASADGQGMAWDTNPTGISNDREQSWVLCPCLNFQRTAKPIISMDVWSDTPLLNDGAVLQYNLTGNIENDADWKVVGVPEQGANWYDETGISSSPGNQSVDPNGNDVGWTGIYGGWKKAAYKLDPLNGQQTVIFRIAFASNVPRREGFAFDNVFIGERTRTVLLESFTNSSQQANTDLHNTFFSNFANNSPELAKIQFHTQFPGADPLNDANSEINNSRAAFYGITETAKFAIDGVVVNAPAGLTKIYDDRVLTPSPIRITISHNKDGEVVKINTTLKNITGQVLPTTGLTFFVAIAEKSITDSDYLGTEDDEFKFVARKMLPDASGTIITEDIPALGQISLPEIVWNDPGLLPGGQASIIVFIQSTAGDNKTVVQSKIIDATELPDVATGIAFPETAGKVVVYPNPANQTVTILYEEPLTEATQVRLVDTFGKEVFSGTIPRGETGSSIRTSDLTPGMYLIRFKRESGAVAWGKVVIRH